MAEDYSELLKHSLSTSSTTSPDTGQFSLLASTPTPAATPPKPEVGLGTRLVNTASALGQAASDLPTYTKEYIANVAEGSRPLDNNGRMDRWAEEGAKRTTERMSSPEAQQPTLLGTKGDWYQTAKSVPFSLGSMGAAVVGGAAGSVAGPVGSAAGSAGASGALAYRADTGSFVRDSLKTFSDKYQQQYGRIPSQDELLAEQERLQPYATQHGLAEAIPEGVGSTIGTRLLGNVFKPGGSVLTKALKAGAGIVAEELPTETVTQQMQHNVAVGAGTSDQPERSYTDPSAWKQSFDEVVVPVLQQSLLLGGGAGAIKAAHNAVSGPLTRAAQNAPTQPTQEIIDAGSPSNEASTQPQPIPDASVPQATGGAALGAETGGVQFAPGTTDQQEQDRINGGEQGTTEPSASPGAGQSTISDATESTGGAAPVDVGSDVTNGQSFAALRAIAAQPATTTTDRQPDLRGDTINPAASAADTATHQETTHGKTTSEDAQGQNADAGQDATQERLLTIPDGAVGNTAPSSTTNAPATYDTETTTRTTPTESTPLRASSATSGTDSADESPIVNQKTGKAFTTSRQAETALHSQTAYREATPESHQVAKFQGGYALFKKGQDEQTNQQTKTASATEAPTTQGAVVNEVQPNTTQSEGPGATDMRTLDAPTQDQALPETVPGRNTSRVQSAPTRDGSGQVQNPSVQREAARPVLKGFTEEQSDVIHSTPVDKLSIGYLTGRFGHGAFKREDAVAAIAKIKSDAKASPKQPAEGQLRNESSLDKSFSDSRRSDTKSSTQLGEVSNLATGVQMGSSSEIPSVSTPSEVLGGNTTGGEPFPDSAGSNTKNTADLRKRHTTTAQSGSSRNVPLQASEVDSDVIPLRGQHEIVNGVVQPVTVNVMHNLTTQQRSPKSRLHDKTVLKPLSADTVDRNTDKSVTSAMVGELSDMSTSARPSHRYASNVKPNGTTESANRKAATGVPTPTDISRAQSEAVPKRAAKSAMTSNGLPGSTVEELKALLPAHTKKMLRSGKLVIVDSERDLPGYFDTYREMRGDLSAAYTELGIAGRYYHNEDTTYLVANKLNSGNLGNVLNHELYHRAEATDTQLQSALSRFEMDLMQRFLSAKKGVGTPIELEAYQRVIDAETPHGDQQEEFRAYIVGEYVDSASADTTFFGKLGRIFDDLIASIRVALIRAGLDMGMVRSLTPADLMAMSKYGAKASGPTRNGSDKLNRFTAATQQLKDFTTGQPRNVTNLSDIDHIIATGKMPTKVADKQSIYDKIATALVDSSRPFDAWTRQLPDQRAAGQMVLAKDRAKRRTAIYEKDVVDKFLRPLAKNIEQLAKDNKMDYRAAKELVGQWMTARYAIEKNKDYIEQDRTAVADATAKLQASPDDKALKTALTKAAKKQQERLAAINEQKLIDPTKTELSVGLAGGYNDFTAKHYMDAIEQKIGRDPLEKSAQHIYDMLAWKLNNDLRDGKVTQEVVDTWFNSPYYVPLTGDPSVDTSEDELFSTGGVNQAADKKAEGRAGSIAQNGIDAAVEQTQKSARYHGWVDFKDTLTDLYDGLLAQAVTDGATPEEAPTIVEQEYRITRRLDNGGPVSATSITVRKDGERYVYDLNNLEAVNALKSLNKEDVPSLLQPVAGFSRGYAKMITQYLPGFAPINAWRDVWERSENIRTRTLPGYENIDMDKVARGTLRTAANPMLVKKLMSVMVEGTKLEGKFSIDETDPDIKTIREMIKEGATSTVGDYLGQTSKDLSQQMKDSLKWTTEVDHIVKAWNNAFELVSTYSVYKSLRDAGVDAKTAASGTLNLMNFGKSGTITGPLRALYVFVNPTMQGGHQLVQTLSTAKGRARATAYFLAGFALYSMLRAIDGDDDDLGENKMDNQSSFITERNIMIPMGDGTYFKIPVGFGMPQMAWSAATNMGKFVFGRQSAGDTMAEVMKSVSRTFAPVAPSEASIANHPVIWAAQTFTPQIGKPIMNVGLDVSAFGTALTNQRMGRADVAVALQGRKSTPQFYKDVAAELGRFGINMYPEQVREILRGYAVGPINEMLKATVENPNKESLGRRSVSNLLDRYVSVHDTGALKERLYYRYRDEMNAAATKASLGETLDSRETELVKMNETIKRLENRANGKLAAATKAEKRLPPGRTSPYRKDAERIRDDAMDRVFKRFHQLDQE